MTLPKENCLNRLRNSSNFYKKMYGDQSGDIKICEFSVNPVSYD